MQTQIFQKNGSRVAVIRDEGVLVKDVPAMLDLIAEVGYTQEAHKLVFFRENIADGFFDLSTGIAGEILQKFSNYSIKAAIVGDFVGFGSKSLQDFIYECNTGNGLFFVSTEEEAVERLHAV